MDLVPSRGRPAPSLRAVAPLALALAASCGVELPPEVDTCPVSARTLALAPGPLAFDGEGEVEITGAAPGETVWFWWSDTSTIACSCPDEVEGCLDLQAPEPLGSVVADETGRAVITVALPPDAPAGPRWIQASTREHTSAVVIGYVSGWLGGDLTLDDAQYTLHGDGLGGAISGVGDLNLDGVQSLVLGAGAQGVAWIAQPSCCGRPGLDIDELPGATRLVGPPSLGRAAAGLGDVNGDGYRDLVISAPDAGRVWLVHGPIPPGEHAIDAIAARTMQQPGAGRSLAVADLDGDGVSEMAIAGPDRVWISSGDSLGPHTTLTGLHAPAVTSAGDLDGDGLGDLAITSGDDLILYFGPGIEERGLTLPGARVAGVGDVDGDGYDDLWVGGPNAHGGRGVVALMLGPIHPLAPVLEGEEPGERLGSQIAAAGDLDGDGQGDLLAYSASQGAVLVLYGPPGGNRSVRDADARIAVPHPGAIAGPGDLDGDGFADVVVGSTAPGAGAVHLFRGAPGW